MKDDTVNKIDMAYYLLGRAMKEYPESKEYAIGLINDVIYDLQDIVKKVKL